MKGDVVVAILSCNCMHAHSDSYCCTRIVVAVRCYTFISIIAINHNPTYVHAQNITQDNRRPQ